MKAKKTLVFALVVFLFFVCFNPRQANADLISSATVMTVALTAVVFIAAERAYSYGESKWDLYKSTKHYLDNPSDWCADRRGFGWEAREKIDQALADKYGKAVGFCLN